MAHQPAPPTKPASPRTLAHFWAQLRRVESLIARDSSDDEVLAATYVLDALSVALNLNVESVDPSGQPKHHGMMFPASTNGPKAHTFLEHLRKSAADVLDGHGSYTTVHEYREAMRERIALELDQRNWRTAREAVSPEWLAGDRALAIASRIVEELRTCRFDAPEARAGDEHYATIDRVLRRIVPLVASATDLGKKRKRDSVDSILNAAMRELGFAGLDSVTTSERVDRRRREKRRKP